jgi:hypothetical protein
MLLLTALEQLLKTIHPKRSNMPGYPVPSGQGYAEIPLGRTEGKPIKSVQVYQYDDALNIDLEFEDESVLEMIFRLRFRASVKLLEKKDGDYHVRRKIKLRRLPK